MILIFLANSSPTLLVIQPACVRRLTGDILENCWTQTPNFLGIKKKKGGGEGQGGNKTKWGWGTNSSPKLSTVKVACLGWADEA